MDSTSHDVYAKPSSPVSSNDFISCNNEENEIDDPISAYFKKRCRNSSQLYFKKLQESDSDSSIGIIDVDNVSLFDKEEETENLRLSENMSQKFQRNSMNANDLPMGSNVSLSNMQSHLEKQRALAQEALSKLQKKNEFESQCDFLLTPEQSRDSGALNNISSKLLNIKLTDEKEFSKNWFKPNFSLGTPRLFNDELSSLGTDDSLAPKNEVQPNDINQKRQSQYAKTVTLMLKELSEGHLYSDLQFDNFTKEEKICKFEEDEKQFKQENAGVLHNSRISQFSGIIGEDSSNWLAEATHSLKLGQENKNLSIGQFFTMRSNSISSLVGSVTNDNSAQILESNKEQSKLVETEMQNVLRNEYSLPISDTLNTDKTKLRRCASSFDLKRISDIPKSARYSNDSCSSNSTVLIQNILAEMESGLSGTQIYEKLMKSYGKKQFPEKEKKKNLGKIIEQTETPKSSKVPLRKDISKLNRKENFEEELIKEVQNPLRPKFILDDEAKENEPKDNQPETFKKSKSRKNFDASTPKLQVLKSQNDRFKSAYNKALLKADDWETLRVSSIQSTIDLSKSEISDENEKTITANSTVNSGDPCKKNCAASDIESYTVEDTISSRDLTVLSQRIKEMKEKGISKNKSNECEEAVLLNVVQKLIKFPQGSIDCSSLITLLRDQFPDLLDKIYPGKEKLLSSSPPNHNFKLGDLSVSEPGSWIKIPKVMGLKEKIYACAEVEQTIFIPITNVTKNWLLVSIESITLIHPSGRKLHAVKKENEWAALDFLKLSMKETLISPEKQHYLKVFFTPKIPTVLDFNLVFALKQLIKKDFQARGLRIRTHNLNPLHNINVSPKDMINFGIISDQCWDSRMVQVSFDGAYSLPLTIYLEEEDIHSQHFILLLPDKLDESGKTKKFDYTFKAKEKQLLEFKIVFQPPTLLDDEDKTQDFKAMLILRLGSITDSDGILQKIPIKGSVGVARFFVNTSSFPLVFRVSGRDQIVNRSFELKNLGSLPIAFSVKIVNEDSTEVEDDLFTAPQVLYLSRNEESSIRITFNANTSEYFIKRLLQLQITPNGRSKYEAELIGLISSTNVRPMSRVSEDSVSTKSTVNLEPKPIKLLTTANSLGWPAVALEKEVTLSFQLKNVSNTPMYSRIFFMKNMDSFKLIHENGEKVQKMRKHLKPNCPITVTVAFRPDSVGVHHNAVFIEMSHNTKKVISLNGIGGLPNIFLANVKSDLSGCKILRLQNCSSSNQFFFNTLKFRNEGRIPGFILIESSMEVPSIGRELAITPTSCVIAPNSTAIVKVTQKLKSEDLKFLLCDKDISKLVTLSIIIGDEPSRLRLRKLVKSGTIPVSELVKSLTSTFNGETEMNLKIFEDSAGFENQFLKSLKMVEVPVVVEKSPGTCEPSILEDADDTRQEFITIISAVDNTTVSSKSLQKELQSCSDRQKQKSNDCDLTLLSGGSATSNNRITKWLETLECP